MDSRMLSSRHIQNHSEAQNLQPYWGYADRVIPCTNDAGTCEYLESVYHGHELGMMYTGIIWATFLGILFVWGVGRLVFHSASRSSKTGLERFLQRSPQPQSSAQRIQRSLASLRRHRLLPEFARPIFGRTTRLQLLILFSLIGYLTIWTFAGITYKRWITPVKKHPGLYNTRSGLGPFSDRIGVMAYALIPLSVLLANRESILSLVTGIPYHHFNFIHRWLGYVILVQSIVHTVGWCVIEFRLYQPQPQVGIDFIKQLYMVWGIVAQILLILLFILSLKPVIRLTGYEFFRKAHYVIAVVFIGACWGHWEQLKCFLLPSILIWFADRLVRLVRTWLIHYHQFGEGHLGFTNARAEISHYPDSINGDIVRLDFTYPHDPWSVGQHFYLCFPELSIWQSHPFTPMSLARPGAPTQRHTYLIRSKRGETKNLATLADAKVKSKPAESESVDDAARTTPVILTGPYGANILPQSDDSSNILCVAGGTGVSYVLPVLLHLAEQAAIVDRKIELIWAVRMEKNIEWIQDEMSTLEATATSHGISIKIFITRECCLSDKTEARELSKEISQAESSSASDSDDIAQTPKKGKVSVSQANGRSIYPMPQRPDLHSQVTDFVESTVRGPTIVYASGPGSMITDLRGAVASCNSARKVWKGEQRHDVSLVCDDRLEW